MASDNSPGFERERQLMVLERRRSEPMFQPKGNVKNVQVRMNVEFFLKYDPPPPFTGWNLPAFQEYCRREMSGCGFDLERKIHCHYNRQTGEIVFWQNVLDLELTDAILN